MQVECLWPPLLGGLPACPPALAPLASGLDMCLRLTSALSLQKVALTIRLLLTEAHGWGMVLGCGMGLGSDRGLSGLPLGLLKASSSERPGVRALLRVRR